EKAGAGRDRVGGDRSGQPGAADRSRDRSVVLRLRAPCSCGARTPLAPRAFPATPRVGARHVSIWQRVVAVILAVAAGVVVVVAVVADDSKSGAASRAATT